MFVIILNLAAMVRMNPVRGKPVDERSFAFLQKLAGCIQVSVGFQRDILCFFA